MIGSAATREHGYRLRENCSAVLLLLLRVWVTSSCVLTEDTARSASDLTDSGLVDIMGLTIFIDTKGEWFSLVRGSGAWLSES
jgi:hypothetical protein